MPKKKQNSKYNIDEEIIIGYNTKKNKDKPSTNNKKSKKQKKKKKNNIWKILKIILKIILCILIAGGIIVFLFVSPVFNITEIKVKGADQISESVYIATSEIEIGQNIFEVRKTDVKNKIEKDPYVESVEVKNVYPGTVEIAVKERYMVYTAEMNRKILSFR